MQEGQYDLDQQANGTCTFGFFCLEVCGSLVESVVVPVGQAQRKVVAITASVPHSKRGRQGLAALRQTLGAVRAVIVSDEPIVRGSASEATMRDVLRRLVDGVRETRRRSG